MNKTKTPRFIIINILTLIAVLSWIVFGVYDALTTFPELEIPQEILEPISPSLDTNSLDRIGSRVFFTEEEIPESIFVSDTEAEETQLENADDLEQLEATESSELTEENLENSEEETNDATESSSLETDG